MNVPAGKSGNGLRVFPALILAITAFLMLQLISLYLSWPKQLILGSASILIGIAANRISSSRLITIALMLISLTATLRYGWWRVRLLIDFFLDQSNNRVSLDSVFMLILISAEAYTMLIMVLGYMQTAWPLRRKPLSLPNDESLWPHVDVLIPTYNEPLPLVRYTALAALNIDYPPEKLHVYILDDGTREDFRAFAEAAGVGYVTRKEHNHAKAGNINHALSTMNSPYVTIFDCDHVPTRSFLQMTLGWMLVDQNLAMLQTPHHFYSPDPFERNLLQYKTIPNEAALFYGIVQDGNDFWNATFFCGSCALIRRSALDDVGGIATENSDGRRAHLAAHAEARIQHRVHQHSTGGRSFHGDFGGSCRPADTLGTRHDSDFSHRQSFVCQRNEIHATPLLPERNDPLPLRGAEAGLSSFSPGLHAAGTHDYPWVLGRNYRLFDPTSDPV